jgi:4-amino-4-deoxy-L-arabinose transferase-like glycosyltransferase
VHPPGIVLVSSPVALLGTDWLGYETAFLVARWMAVIAGGVNVWLVGRLALKWRGPVAALLATSLYATFPPAVRHENSTMIEPFLNLAALTAAAVWLGKEGERRSSLHLATAGVAFGVLPGFKLYGGSPGSRRS